MADESKCTSTKHKNDERTLIGWSCNRDFTVFGFTISSLSFASKLFNLFFSPSYLDSWEQLLTHKWGAKRWTENKTRKEKRNYVCTQNFNWKSRKIKEQEQ